MRSIAKTRSLEITINATDHSLTNHGVSEQLRDLKKTVFAVVQIMDSGTKRTDLYVDESVKSQKMKLKNRVL